MNNAYWTSLVRSLDPFIAYNEIIRNDIYPMGFQNTTSFKFGKGVGTDKYVIHTVYPTTIDNSPAYIYMINPRTIGGDVQHPSSLSPAPAQTADLMVIIWVKSLQHIATYGYDLNAGLEPPEGVPLFNVIGDKTAGNYWAADSDIHRTDGKPAVVIARNLRKWYTDGKLHRKGASPAMSADFVGGIWYQDGNRYRATGPASIGITNYREYHVHGEFQGYRMGSVHEMWSRPKPVIDGGTNPLSTRYCNDVQDEFAIAASC